MTPRLTTKHILKAGVPVLLDFLSAHHGFRGIGKPSLLKIVGALGTYFNILQGTGVGLKALAHGLSKGHARHAYETRCGHQGPNEWHAYGWQFVLNHAPV